MSDTERHVFEHSNPFPVCAGLELSVPQHEQGSDVFWLNAEIVFGQEPVSGEGVSFRLGVRTGLLRLDLQACRIVSDSRYAMLDQPASVLHEVREEETQASTAKAEGSAGGRLAANPTAIGGRAELGGKLAGSRTSERTTYSKREGVQEIRKITARGTNSEPSWEIQDPDSECLNGRYLGEENLCQIAPDDKSYSITASFLCQKRDLALIDIECEGRHRLTPNKEKLALAVIAKRLGGGTEDEIQLCRSVAKAKTRES